MTHKITVFLIVFWFIHLLPISKMYPLECKTIKKCMRMYRDGQRQNLYAIAKEILPFQKLIKYNNIRREILFQENWRKLDDTLNVCVIRMNNSQEAYLEVFFQIPDQTKFSEVVILDHSVLEPQAAKT